MDNSSSLDDELKAKLNKETAKISWEELQRFYAAGAVVAVSRDIDLIEVAMQFSHDNKAAVEQWMTQGVINRVEDEQAKQWNQQSITLWAVVVAPWILVQALKDEGEAPQ